jgi:hypothetical protein
MKVKFKNFEDLKKAVDNGEEVNWINDNYIVQYWGKPNFEYIVHSKSNDNNSGLFEKNGTPIYPLKEFYIIKEKTMKLKKGSQAAKNYMASIRAKKKGPKKAAVKKATVKKAPIKSMHKDTKSHNVKISVVSGINKNSTHAEKYAYAYSIMKLAQDKMLRRENLNSLENKLLSLVFSYGFHNGAKEAVKQKLIY